MLQFLLFLLLMAYFTKYIIDFPPYQLLIKTNGLSGSPVTATAGSPAVVHKWDVDEPTAPIKGSSLEANIIGLPLLTFYSESDISFKGELYYENTLKFAGFIVQDDCQEDVDDLAHSTALSFTDGLGLLKDVSFGDAIAQPITSTVLVHINASGFAIDTSYPFSPGDVFTIVGFGTFTIDTVTGPTTYTTTTALPTLSGFYNLATSKVLTESKISLFAILQACLKATSLELPLEIFSQLAEDGMGSNGSFFEEILVARETFLKDEREYEDCYGVLEKVLSRFDATLMQANGQWNIIRWHEQKPATASYKYDVNFGRLTNGGAYDQFKAFGREEGIYPEYGYSQKIVRPFNIVKESFRYNSPNSLLKNADLQELGALITTYTVNEEDFKPDEDPDTTNDYTVTYKEYEMPRWVDSALGGSVSDLRIRVVIDSLGNELERYAVVTTDASKSADIEACAGDIVQFDFQIRNPAGAVSTPSTLVFIIQLRDGTRTVYAHNDTTWQTTTGFTYQSSNNYQNWTGVTIKTGRIPFDGLLNVYLTNNFGTAHYNDMRFKYISYINESTKVIGHSHTQAQPITIKNKDEQDITLDDSPRNFIAGTLFRKFLVGLIQERTKLWNDGLGEGKPLGVLISNQQKQWRSKARTITEGSLYGDPHVSPLTTFTSPIFPGLNLVPGRMEIEYVVKKVSGTLHEIYKTGEDTAIAEYSFEYIYDTK
jgi:hypothetical protein